MLKWKGAVVSTATTGDASLLLMTLARYSIGSSSLQFNDTPTNMTEWLYRYCHDDTDNKSLILDTDKEEVIKTKYVLMVVVVCKT